MRRLSVSDLALMRPSSLPGLAYTFVPRQDVRIAGGRYRIDEWGFKDSGIRKEKPAGTLRVMIVGDSIAFGQGARRTDIARELKRRLGEKGGRRVEVVNTGVPSYSTCQELIYVRDALDAFSPDLIIVAYAPNDPEGPRTPFGLDIKTGRISPWWRAYHFIKQRLTLVKFAVARLSPIIVRWRGHAYYGPPVRQADEARYVAALHDPASPYWEACAACIRGFGEYQRRRGVPVAFAVFPMMNHLDDPRLQEAFSRVARTARQAGLATLELQKVYAKLPTEVLARIQTDGMHPNDEGHELAAAAIELLLRSDPRLLAGRKS